MRTAPSLDLHRERPSTDDGGATASRRWSPEPSRPPPDRDPGEDPVLSEEEANAQLAWASGRLQHRWLWRDVEVGDWFAALLSFEWVAGGILRGVPVEPLTGAAEAVGIAGYTSGMGPLLGHWVETGALSATPEIETILARHLRHNRARMRSMHARAGKVVAALAAAGVRPLVMKGMHTAFSCFPDPGTRPLSDIDLLIAREERELAGEVLHGLGFRAGAETKYPKAQNWAPSHARSVPLTLRYLHRDDPWSVDLQVSLNRKCAPGAPIAALDQCDLLGTTETWSVSSAARQMNPSALALHLMVHGGYGLESLTLLRICELILVVRSNGGRDSFDWHWIEGMAKKGGALEAIFPMIRMVEVLAPGTLPGRLCDVATAATPRSIKRRMASLSPATAQRVMRVSIAERFMWSASPWRILHHLVDYATFAHAPPGRQLASVGHRFGRLMRIIKFQ